VTDFNTATCITLVSRSILLNEYPHLPLLVKTAQQKFNMEFSSLHSRSLIWISIQSHLILLVYHPISLLVF